MAKRDPTAELQHATGTDASVDVASAGTAYSIQQDSTLLQRTWKASKRHYERLPTIQKSLRFGVKARAKTASRERTSGRKQNERGYYWRAEVFNFHSSGFMGAEVKGISDLAEKAKAWWNHKES
jgi:hypothetical protein